MTPPPSVESVVGAGWRVVTAAGGAVGGLSVSGESGLDQGVDGGGMGTARGAAVPRTVAATQPHHHKALYRDRPCCAVHCTGWDPPSIGNIR